MRVFSSIFAIVVESAGVSGNNGASKHIDENDAHLAACTPARVVCLCRVPFRVVSCRVPFRFASFRVVVKIVRGPPRFVSSPRRDGTPSLLRSTPGARGQRRRSCLPPPRPADDCRSSRSGAMSSTLRKRKLENISSLNGFNGRYSLLETLRGQPLKPS